MKSVYILQSNGVILMVSANRKAVYDCLSNGLSEFNKTNLISYSQLTRRLKKSNVFHYVSAMGSDFEISRKRVFSSYQKFKEQKTHALN